MTHPDDNIEQEENEDPFEEEDTPVKDPKDEKIDEVPPEFEDDDEEEEEDPFEIEEEDKE